MRYIHIANESLYIYKPDAEGWWVHRDVEVVMGIVWGDDADGRGRGTKECEDLLRDPS